MRTSADTTATEASGWHDHAIMANPERFQIFLDESGDFRETSTKRTEKELAARQRFPSQLAGLLVPQGKLTRGTATSLLTDICSAAGQTYDGQFHATEIRDNQVLDTMVQHLLPALGQRQWQPVRMVNLERMVFGDRVTTYTNLVAELTLRCFQNLSLARRRPIEIELHCAAVFDELLNDTFNREDYLDRLREVMARASIRAGAADLQRNWKITRFVFRSGSNDPELHLCDLISNTSKGSFDRLQPTTATEFEAAFGSYDLSLMVREDLQRIDALAADGSVGMALVTLAERTFDHNLDDGLRTRLHHRLRSLVDALAALSAPARDPQLQIIATFLEQTIQWERDLERGRSHCDWFLQKVVTPLEQRLPELERPEVAWFAFQLHQRRLSAANHLGDLVGARASLEQLEALQPTLVQHWERLDLFFHAQIVQAVHLTDCREFDRAKTTAMRVARFHQDLGGLFQDAMPEALKEPVRSARCAQALGTAMQAAMLGSAINGDPQDEARSLGDAAIEEFSSADDRARQYQYRCQLETLDGHWQTAREWLARAIGIETASHTDLGTAIAGCTTDSVDQAFLLLHWLRLGAMVNRDEPQGEEATAFRSAWQASGLVTTAWCTGDRHHHPAPSILRYLGEVQLLGDEENHAVNTLRKLRDLVLPIRSNGPLMSLPLIGLQSEFYISLTGKRPAAAGMMLDQSGKNGPGLKQLLVDVGAELETFPAWKALFDEWLETVSGLAQGLDPSLLARLSKCARAVIY